MILKRLSLDDYPSFSLFTILIFYLTIPTVGIISLFRHDISLFVQLCVFGLDQSVRSFVRRHFSLPTQDEGLQGFKEEFGLTIQLKKHCKTHLNLNFPYYIRTE